MSALPAPWLRHIGAWQWSGPWARRVVQWSSRWMRRSVVVIRHGAGAGLVFDAGGANPGYALGTTEPLVQQALREHLRAGDVLYDIGANVGFFTVLGARLVGAGGAVYAFEPLAENANALRRNVELNGFRHVTVIEAAVSRASGEGSLVLADEPTWARLASGGAGGRSGRTVRVPLVAIDELIAQGRVSPPSLVKIDVEGVEVDVLRGMERTLRHHRPVVICELHYTNAEVGAFFRRHGYDTAVLEREGPIESAPADGHVVASPTAHSSNHQ
ncbi:MAG: FkbM family methyltransferase [Gemmatimonadetes bacterium]|nr:FkbM family methyltransferase [Gemmatimonadota bacterium]